jgi:hypothetical protein
VGGDFDDILVGIPNSVGVLPYLRDWVCCFSCHNVHLPSDGVGVASRTGESLVGAHMFAANPNPFLQMPGKIVLDVQRKRMPSGQIVETRTVERTILENGYWRKERVKEHDPGMSDATSPKIEDIRECHVCLGLFHKENVRHCIACGRDYCDKRECWDRVETPGIDSSIIACSPCAKENNMSILARISRRFWRMRM